MGNERLARRNLVSSFGAATLAGCVAAGNDETTRASTPLTITVGDDVVAAVATVADLRAYPSSVLVPDDGSTVIVHGFATPGDLNGGVYVFDASSTASADDALVVLSDAVGPLSPGRWHRVSYEVQHELPIEEFWREADGNDWVPAFERAQQYAGVNGGITIILGAKLYTCSSTVHVWTGLHLRGNAEGKALQSAAQSGGDFGVSTLYFPTPCHGIEVHFFNSAPGHTTDDSRARFVIEGVVIHGAGPLADAGQYRYHALVPHIRMAARHCTFRNFPGDGLHNDSTVSGTNSGNAMVFENCRFHFNGRHGIYHVGGDTNINLFIACECNNNGEGKYQEFGGAAASQAQMDTIRQILDTSFLGNHYIGMHVAGNVNGSNYPVELQGKSTWIGGYLEGGVGILLNEQAIAIGSRSNMHGQSTGSALSAESGWMLVRHSIGAQNARATGALDAEAAVVDQTKMVEGRLGSKNQPMTALEFCRGDDTTVVALTLIERATGEWWWEFREGTGNAARYECWPHKSQTQHAGRPWKPNGVYVGRVNNNTPGPLLTSGAAAPTSGYYTRGSMVLNQNAATGQPSYWQCTVAGTPGTWVASPTL